jgi:hypothetical protein
MTIIEHIRNTKIILATEHKGNKVKLVIFIYFTCTADFDHYTVKIWQLIVELCRGMRVNPCEL